MPFNPIDEYPTLPLPIKGKTYVVNSPDAATGLYVQSIMTAAAAVRHGHPAANADVDTVLDDDDERALHQRVLGDTYQQLLDDNVPWHTLKHAGATTVLWISHGTDAAEAYWNGGNDPKAVTPDPANTENADPPA